MKLLVNAISAKQGGIVTYTQNMIRWMREHRVDAVFAVPKAFEAEGSNVLRLQASDFGPARRLIWEQSIWPMIIRRQRPDILFSSANFGLLFAPVPQVLLIREGGLFDRFYLDNLAPSQGLSAAFMRSWRRRLMIASARWADQVITPSRTMRDLILAWRPGLAGKIEVCPYGTRRTLFSPSTELRPWRNHGRLRVIYVSVYYPHKNPLVVCEAVRQLNAEGFPAEATITMDLAEIGAVRGGALDALMMKRAVESGLVRLGRQHYEDLPKLYAAHDVFVFPSVSESFGHPMVEAMASGLPVVAADTPINREICGEGALYFRPFSSAGLVARLHELDQNPTLRRHLVETSQRRVASLFSWDDHMTRLMSIFEGVLANRRGARRQTA